MHLVFLKDNSLRTKFIGSHSHNESGGDIINHLTDDGQSGETRTLSSRAVGGTK